MSTDMTVGIEFVTPEQARLWLSRNPQNRHIKRTAVDAYKRDMLAGRFQLNGQSVVIDVNGNLLDGQHRLTACAESGVALQTIVVRNAPPDVRATIDSGVKRTHADRLAMRGFGNANAISSATKLLWGMASGRGRFMVATPQELDAMIKFHPGIPESVAKSRKSFRGMQTFLAAFHYIGVYNGLSDRADAMIQVWKTGSPDYGNCPMHLVRERIVRTQGTPSEPTYDVKFRLLCAAWIPFTKSASVKIVRPMERPAVPHWTESDLPPNARVAASHLTGDTA